MISILIIVIIILVVSFVLAFIISGNKDYDRTKKLVDDPSVLFENESNDNTVNNREIAEEIEIEKDEDKKSEEVEELFDDELI